MKPILKKIIQQVEQLFEEKKYNEIIEFLNDKLLTQYNDAILYVWRSRSQGGIGDVELSFINAQKSIEINPLLAIGYLARGNAWFNKKEYDKAISDYTEAIKLGQSDAIIYHNRGYAWANKKDYNKAIIDYTEAIKLDQNYAKAYLNRGNVWVQKNEYNKAIFDYSEAIRSDQNFALSYYNRGSIWSEKKKYDKAIADFERYVELVTDPNDYYKQVSLSKIGEIKKRIENAWYEEIDSIVDRIKRILLFNSPCLTHYTSLSSARAMILKNSPFRLSEGAFLNDTSEGRELFNYLSYKTANRNTNETIAELYVERPFIGSFVAETKHNDLTLWRMYGKEAQDEAKGCALTIYKINFIDNLKKTLIPTNIKADIQSKSEEQFTFYNVAYLKNNTFTIPGNKKTTEKFLNIIMSELKNKVKNLNENQKTSIAKILNDIAYLFKSSEYQYENEVRLVVQGVGFTKKIEIEGTPPKVYIELVDIVPALNKITLGPKVERADEWAAAFNYHIKEQLKDRKGKVEIIISHLPFK